MYSHIPVTAGWLMIMPHEEHINTIVLLADSQITHVVLQHEHHWYVVAAPHEQYADSHLGATLIVMLVNIYTSVP